jgi:hypothetical protein
VGLRLLGVRCFFHIDARCAGFAAPVLLRRFCCAGFAAPVLLRRFCCTGFAAPV